MERPAEETTTPSFTFRQCGSLRYLLQLGPPAEPDAPVSTVLFFSGITVVATRPVLQAGTALAMERLQRIIAAHGIASPARASEQLILDRVEINGKVVRKAQAPRPIPPSTGS
ncbi:MAG: hypothetical protein R2855_12290 [Thermomicrobiales bacterium]